MESTSLRPSSALPVGTEQDIDNNVVEICGTEKSNITDLLFPTLFLQSLNSLWEIGVLTDVVIVVEGEKIPAHKIILAAASPYFRTMFTSGLKEANQNEIPMLEVRFSDMKNIINFIYTGGLEVDGENIFCLIQLADLLGVYSVRSHCEHVLTSLISTDNCLFIIAWADMMGLVDIKRRVHHYTCKHFDKVIETKDFLEASYDLLMSFLNSKFLNVPSEEKLLAKLCAWVTHVRRDRTSQSIIMMSLLGKVNVRRIENWDTVTAAINALCLQEPTVKAAAHKWLGCVQAHISGAELVKPKPPFVKNNFRYCAEQEILYSVSDDDSLES